MLDQRAERLSACVQMRFRLLAFGDVASERQHAHDFVAQSALGEDADMVIAHAA